MKLRATGNKRKRKTFRGAGRAVIKKAKKIIKKAKKIRRQEMQWHSGVISFNCDITGIRGDATSYFASTITYTNTMDRIFSMAPKVSTLRTLYEYVKLVKARYTFIPYRRPNNALANYEGLSVMGLEPRPEASDNYPPGNTVHDYYLDHKKVKVSYGRSVSMALPSVRSMAKDTDLEEWQASTKDPGNFYLPGLGEAQPPRIHMMTELAVSSPPVAVLFFGHIRLSYTVAFKQFKNR